MTKPRTLTARHPEDLLAIVPVVLGFHPEQSLVMLTFGPGETFHARVDLPPPDLPRHLERVALQEAVGPLLQAAQTHRIQRVAFVLYTPAAELAGRARAAVAAAFRRAHIDVITIFRSDGSRWFADVSAPSGGQPYDPSSHPFAAQAVFDGTVTHRNRAALVASVAGDPGVIEGVWSGLDAELCRLADLEPAVETEWMTRLVQTRVSQASPPELTDREVARILVVLTEVRVRDAAWALLERPTADRQVALWTDVVRRSPEELVAAPACLLAYAAWLTGHGALAWCALDRCLAAEPRYRLAQQLALALDHAVPPSAWDRGGSR